MPIYVDLFFSILTTACVVVMFVIHTKQRKMIRELMEDKGLLTKSILAKDAIIKSLENQLAHVQALAKDKERKMDDKINAATEQLKLLEAGVNEARDMQEALVDTIADKDDEIQKLEDKLKKAKKK